MFTKCTEIVALYTLDETLSQLPNFFTTECMGVVDFVSRFLIVILSIR